MKLEEMANCRPRRTGLQMNIWIDETSSYLRSKHSKRIKFQINKSPKFQPNNVCSMLFDGTIPNKQLHKMYSSNEFNLEKQDLIEVANFVKNNAYALNKIADQQLDLDDFWEFCIKGGKIASENEILSLEKKTDFFSHP